MNEKKQGSCEQISPNYGQTGNVKPLTEKRSRSFAVKWQNLNFKVFIMAQDEAPWAAPRPNKLTPLACKLLKSSLRAF